MVDISSSAKDLEDYAQSLNQRINYLDPMSMKLISRFSEIEEKKNEYKAANNEILRELKEDLEEIKDNLNVEVKNILKLIAQFKNSLDIAKFKALKQRVNAYQGEQYISRAEFKKWLEKEF